LKVGDLKIKKLSIIIPTFNDASALKNTLSSLSNLPYVDMLDVIVVDGNSCDDTPEVIIEFTHIINIFHSAPDTGEYDAMNKGIDLSTAKYLIFLMAGDCLHQNNKSKKLESINNPSFVAVFRKNVNAGLDLLRTKPSLYFGLPHCHQGIIYKKPIPYFDLNYKISSDYDHFLNCEYPAKLPFYDAPFFVVYDEGNSGENYLIRDKEILVISRKNFGSLVWAVVFCIFQIKHLLKFILRYYYER